MDTIEPRHRPATALAQHGAALLITLVLIGVIAALAMIKMASSAATDAQRVQDTARAMGIIRDALIARAAGDLNRPGSLPCPDYDNDGTADGSLCTAPYIGRVPWKTLDLPDLRDAAGERFWYALSPTFRDHQNACSPTPCVLNSDTPADLTLNGVASQENVAIIFAPGGPLGSQNRDPAVPANLTTAGNYLEGNNVPSGVNDVDYQLGPPTTTFNDQALVITRDMLMPAVEQRVARQARKCLEKYAALSGGRYPYAAPIAVAGFDDVAGILTGRLPATIDDTDSALGTAGWPADDMQDPGRTGTENCFRIGSPPTDPSWWDSWRELLLYRVSQAYAPGGTGDCTTNACLNVNGQGNVQFVVIVAGRTLLAPQSPAQVRTSAADKSSAINYLEAAPPPNTSNVVGFSTGNFQRRSLAATAGPSGRFNDRLECLGAATCN